MSPCVAESFYNFLPDLKKPLYIQKIFFLLQIFDPLCIGFPYKPKIFTGALPP